jgi:murein DD-endopeptidase MepM/ murein hydrolase activator NlpD
LKVNRKRLIIVCAAVGLPLLAVLVGWLALVGFEGEKPGLELSLASAYIGADQQVSLQVSDRKSGVRSIWAALAKNGKEYVVFDEEFDQSGRKVNDTTLQIKIDPIKLGIEDGPAVLRIVARDNSWRRWWHGNIAYIEKEIIIDTQPPEIHVISRLHYLNQGGSGLVVYRLTEPCPQSGVFVGNSFFPGYKGLLRDEKIFLAFIALDVNQGPDTRIFISATDPAGNQAQARFHYSIRAKKFKKDTVNISDRFLQRKIPQFTIENPEQSGRTTLDQFVWANRDLRIENYKKIAGIAAASRGVIHWKAAFLRMPGSARKAGFGDQRTYRYTGQVVDRQVHRGIDLASVLRAPVPAANHGRVAYAGPLGIYGNTVLIDHGCGLLSNYSHLSRIDVQVNQMVSRGDIIGRTGSTGLAGGDHLHFGIAVQGTFVNPVEWWDAAWIKNNITAKIAEAEKNWQ